MSPNRNPVTKALLGEGKYEYPGHCLKLHLDKGEIDFLIGTEVSNSPTMEWEFEGRMLLIDTPWETAAKKLFYRPSKLKVRDVFDLAAVIAARPDELRNALPEIVEKLPLAIDRVDAMLDRYEELAVEEVNATKFGSRFMRREAAGSVLSFLQDWQYKPRL